MWNANELAGAYTSEPAAGVNELDGENPTVVFNGNCGFLYDGGVAS